MYLIHIQHQSNCLLINKYTLKVQSANNQKIEIIYSMNILVKSNKSKVQFLQHFRHKTFQQVLNPSKELQISNISELQFSSYREIQQLAKKHNTVKQALKKSKDEKIKLNRIVLSHKQSEDIKLQYLKTKKQQMDMQIKLEIKNMYEQYFKEEYQQKFGHNFNAEAKFSEKISELVDIMASQIFIK